MKQEQEKILFVAQYINRLLESPRFLQMAIISLTILVAVMVVQNQGKLQQNFSLSPPVKNILIGKTITPVPLNTLDGDEVDLGKIESDYIVLIFFSTDCPYCVKDLPLWQKIYERSVSRNISLFGITSEVNEQAISEYVVRQDISFPVLLDQEKKLFAQFQIVGTPTKVLLSSDWHILQYWLGWTTQQSHQSDLGGIYAFLGVEPDELPANSSTYDFSPNK
jgi:peroxiredoxin